MQKNDKIVYSTSGCLLSADTHWYMADIFEVFLTFFIIVVALVAVILFIACGKSVVFLNEISCIISRSNATPKLGKVAHARQSSQ